MMRKLLYSFLLFILSKFSSKRSFTPSLGLLCVGMFFWVSNIYSQCAYPTGATSVGSYSFCLDGTNPISTANVSTGRYALLDVIKGFNYTFSVADTFSGNENLTIFDAVTNANFGVAGYSSGSSGTNFSWTATISGQIKILLTNGNCGTNATGNRAITIRLNSIGNTQETQNEYGTNTWIGHIYNAGGQQPTPFALANYAGNYNVGSETISEDFGGSGACFPVYSDGVRRAQIYTEGFAVRYKMKTTKSGCYIVTMTGDDGVRLYINGTNVFDRWVEQGSTTYNNVLVRFDGDDDLIFDYYENAGSNVVAFSMLPFDPNSNTITAPATVNFCSTGDPAVIGGSLQYNSGDANMQNPQLNFQWQLSTDGGPFANISGATGRTYDPPSITATSVNIVRRYKRLVTFANSMNDANSVKANCGYAESNIVTIMASPNGTTPATPQAITGTIAQCPSITGQVYSVPVVANAIVYNWTVPANWTITAGAGTNNITVTTGAAGQGGTISVTAQNGCGTSAARTLAVTVNASNTIVRSSAIGTDSQTRCSGTGIENITYNTSGATGASFTGLPPGVNGAWSGNVVTISGTPSTTVGSPFNYTVTLTGGCGNTTTTGSITVNPLHTITAGANRSVCQNNAMASITMTLGGGATGATVTGLPSGVTSSVVSGVLTISGTPTVSGQFTYNVTTTGNSCTVATTSGTITIGVGNNTISYTNGTSGTVCAFAAENNPIDFIAPAGNYFSTVTFASYGLPDGACGSYTIGSCHNNSSQSITEGFLLGKSNTVSFLANNTNYPDPCLNIVKRFRGSASYTQPICQGTTAPIISGSTPTGNGTYTYSWESSITGLAGSFSPISGTNSKDYSPGILNQSTFFRRIVTSNGCSSTSTMVLVKVNPRPTSVVSGTTSICNGTSATVSVALTGTAPWSLTYSDGTNTTNVSGITASPYTFNVSPTANTTYTVTALNDVNNCPSIPADRTGNAVISINPRPTAAVSGSTTICSGASTTISVAFTGTAPWNISYTYGATSGSFSTSLNPYTVNVNPTSTTTYAITALNDANCSALAAGITGDATITVNPLPTTPTVAKTDITCETSGGVSITNLPSGNWTINQTGTALQTISGTGSSHSIANLAAGTYYFTVTNASNCTSSPAVSATIVDQISTTIWNGSSWSNGDPDSSKRVVVNSAANQPFTANIAACSLTVNVPTGAGDPNVIIPNGVTLTITNSVTSNGKLIFESGSSLVQTTNAVNTGEIVYKRTTSVRRYDLTYWSMPVTKSGFTMYDLSPGTLYDKFQYYDSDAGKWAIDYNGTMKMQTGKGYNIRAPQSYDLTTPQNFTAEFKGVPNNGDVPVSLVIGKWNLIGNPYPSAISARQLMTDNPYIGSLYFWGHDELPVRNPSTGVYSYNGDFTAYNASGATSGGKGLPFDGYIAATQGFMIKPEVNIVNFNNINLRRAGNNGQFYKTAESEEIVRNRVWLNFANNNGVFKQILFGYIQGATNVLDVNFDAVSMGANSLIDFYSINSNKKLLIQGRALPFEKSDEVPLGYKLAAKGEYTISIDHADGIFNNQDVYLEDKETGKITNLRLGNYTFTTAEGTFNSRFVIRYTSKTLGTDDFENLENSVIVSVKDGVVKITSSKESLKEVNIFNIGAQLLYNKNKVDSSELIISSLHSSDQTLLVKITLENGHTFTKKIIYTNL